MERLDRRRTEKTMKVRTTAKEIKAGGRPLAFGYCSVQHILSDDNPQFYTTGTYGWNADIYDFGSFQAVTGYRPFGKDTHAIPYHLMDRAAEDRERRKEVREDFITLCRQLAMNNPLDEEIIAKYQEGKE